MRPIATEQDVLRHPLNVILGTQANVRLVRFLAIGVAGPIGAPDAAERTGLTDAGARRALERLVRSGLLERIGGGRAQRYRLREAAPLVPHIRALFAAEQDRYQGLVRRLRDVLAELPEVRVAWIETPPTETGEPLHIGLICDVRALGYLEEQVRLRVAETESEYDLTIELHLFGRADAPDVAPRDVVLLVGHLDESVPEVEPTHEGRIERAAKLSSAIADLLERDETLVPRAIAHLDQVLERDQGAARHDLREWRNLLAHYSRHRLQEFLVSESPRAQRLRQSSPFFAVLTADERERLFDAIGAER